MNIELMYCPFCGCIRPQLERDGVCDFYYYVRCPICGARTPGEYTEEAAAKRWNSRVTH